MKIINAIKSFFKRKTAEEEKKEIDIKNLEAWFNLKNNETEALIKKEKEAIRNEINKLINKLKEETDVLSQVNLHEKKSEQRIKEITELGRKDYISAINKLIESLKEDKEIPFIAKEIDSFAQHSAKSHFKTTILIGKEIDQIQKTITTIRKLETDFLKNNRELIEKREIISTLIKKNEEKNKKEKQKEGILKEIEKAKGSIERYRIQFAELEKDIEEIKESGPYKKKQNFIEEKKEKDGSLQMLNFRIKTLLDKKILEKFAYIEEDDTNKKLLYKYLNNPIQAILSDLNLNILNLLENARSKIKTNEILLKEPLKAIEKITIDKSVFLDYKNQFIKLSEEINELTKKASEINIDFSNLENEKSTTESRIAEEENNLNILTKTQNKIDFETEKINSELKENLLKLNVILK